jgi:hypothetical protein
VAAGSRQSGQLAQLLSKSFTTAVCRHRALRNFSMVSNALAGVEYILLPLSHWMLGDR